jgi:YhgE/Pip-like protein
LALLEIKRFHKPLQLLALAFIVLVPLLYGGLYLWSNWDPYGRFSQIPVAVVNDDQPVTVNNQKVNAGQLFVDELKADKIFDWHFVSDEQARQGLNNTDYYFAISIPRDRHPAACWHADHVGRLERLHRRQDGRDRAVGVAEQDQRGGGQRLLRIGFREPATTPRRHHPSGERRRSVA